MTELEAKERAIKGVHLINPDSQDYEIQFLSCIFDALEAQILHEKQEARVAYEKSMEEFNERAKAERPDVLHP